MAAIPASGKSCGWPGSARREFSAADGVGRLGRILVRIVLLQSGDQVSNPPPASQESAPAQPGGGASQSKICFWISFAVPLAAFATLGLHGGVSKNQPAIETRSYSQFLELILAGGIGATGLQVWWLSLRRWMGAMCPIIAAAVLLLAG